MRSPAPNLFKAKRADSVQIIGPVATGSALNSATLSEKIARSKIDEYVDENIDGNFNITVYHSD
jgi:hypothetical protein